MPLSAAYLQRRHNLEGASDPFPSLTESPDRRRHTPQSFAKLDTDSQSAFPSLASATPSATAINLSAGKYGKPNQKTLQTTSQIKADTQKELEKAKRSLLALLSPVITLTINALVSTIVSIIGIKAVAGKVTPAQNDDEDEINRPVTLAGPQPLAYEAQATRN
ncbi:hypothetical protein FB451DRAFT_1549703 [Mycena latifolia]|nr:hypothetical protein FB451DRAFT_1549703 [Mycena latifolia]